MDCYDKERGRICATGYLQDWKLNKKGSVKTSLNWKSKGPDY